MHGLRTHYALECVANAYLLRTRLRNHCALTKQTNTRVNNEGGKWGVALSPPSRLFQKMLNCPKWKICHICTSGTSFPFFLSVYVFYPRSQTRKAFNLFFHSRLSGTKGKFRTCGSPQDFPFVPAIRLTCKGVATPLDPESRPLQKGIMPFAINSAFFLFYVPCQHPHVFSCCDTHNLTWGRPQNRHC